MGSQEHELNTLEQGLAKEGGVHDSFRHVAHDCPARDVELFDTWHTIGTSWADVQKHYRFFQLERVLE